LSGDPAESARNSAVGALAGITLTGSGRYRNQYIAQRIAEMLRPGDKSVLAKAMPSARKNAQEKAVRMLAQKAGKRSSVALPNLFMGD